MTLCCGDGVRATTRSEAGGVARSVGVGSMVTPKCDRATAEECTTTAATISVNVVIANPGLRSDSVERCYTSSPAVARQTGA
jgi:hypothetical protein